MTNLEAYEGLTEAGLMWDRKDDRHIWVGTNGYKTEDCREVERFLGQAGMVCLDQEFDSISGKTISLFRHK